MLWKDTSARGGRGALHATPLYQSFPAEDVTIEANPVFGEVESALKKNVSLECTGVICDETWERGKDTQGRAVHRALCLREHSLPLTSFFATPPHPSLGVTPLKRHRRTMKEVGHPHFRLQDEKGVEVSSKDGSPNSTSVPALPPLHARASAEMSENTHPCEHPSWPHADIPLGPPIPALLTNNEALRVRKLLKEFSEIFISLLVCGAQHLYDKG